MTRFIERIGLYFDLGARWMAAAVMVVLTLNVIMRIFGVPLKGTVEIVQFLTALAIGLGIAHCAAQGGHVAVTFFTDKFSPKIQGIISIFVESLVTLFLIIAAWEIFQYGNGMQQSGEIALAIGIPFYPIVYVIAACFFVYFMVSLLGLVKTLQNVFGAKSDLDDVIKPEDNIVLDKLIS